MVEAGQEGLSPKSDLPINPKIDRVIHCASDTSFSERHSSRVWAANVDNLKGLVNLLAQARIPASIYLSTAYAAGQRKGRCPETPIQNRHFFNAYEASKAYAEKMLQKMCLEKGLSSTIVRPIIVYGHSRTGRTFRFNALYYPIKTALFLRKIFLADIRERNGTQAAKMGVQLDAEGRIHLPIRIDVGKSGGLNLIPVDFFVAAFCAVIEAASDGGIFHIVNSCETPIGDIVRYAQNQFGMSGIGACPSKDISQNPRNALEQLFDRYLEANAPYMKEQRRFSTQRIDRILKRHGLVCPPFDAGMCRRSMAYAVKSNWAGLVV